MTSTRTAAAPWIRFPFRPPPSARVRLFCLPHAGGSAMSYRDWIQGSTDELEVAAVQPRGHGDRLGESPHTDASAYLDDLVAALIPHLDRPYALYGHSMGARLGLLLTRMLVAAGAVAPPLALFVGACADGRTPASRPVRDDAALLDWIRRVGGTPEDVLASPELLRLVLPVIRADLEVLASCPVAGTPVPVPIHAFAGASDPIAPAAAMLGWSDESTVEFSLTTVAGGHLFLSTSGERVLAVIRSVLSS